MRRPLAVALTGGIGAGKSEALAAFARHGAAVASSDEIVHRVYRRDADVKADLRVRWGEGVFAGGEVDRAAVARIVFADRDELDWLERRIHPVVRREYARWLEELREGDDPPQVAVVEVPLLYETGGEERFDKVVLVTAPPDVRRARGAALEGREQRLIPDEEKLRRADFSFVNDGSLEALDAFAARVLEELACSS